MEIALKADYKRWLAYVTQILGYAQNRAIKPDNARKFLDEVERANPSFQNWFFENEFNKESFLKAIAPAVKAQKQLTWLQHATVKTAFRAVKETFGMFDSDDDGEAITFVEDGTQFVIIVTKIGIKVYFSNRLSPISFNLENGMVVIPTLQVIKDLTFFNRRAER